MRSGKAWILSAAIFFAASTAHADTTVNAQAWPPELTIGDEVPLVITPSFRIHADHTWMDNDAARHPTGAELRRLRFGLSAELGEAWEFKWASELGGDDHELKDLFLSYHRPDGRLNIGQFKEPFSMEQLESSNDFLFIERSAANALAPDRKMGVMWTQYTDRWSLTGGLFTHDAEKDTQTNYAFSARATAAPQFANWADSRFHVGVAGSYRHADEVSLDAGPVSNLSPIATVDTGTIRNVQENMLLGLEAAAGWRSILVQAEYFSEYVDTRQTDHYFDGAYVQLSWLLTGEQRPYEIQDAIFGGITPKRPFNPQAGDWGAWELGARMEYFDVNDGTIQGGKQRGATVGVNWYLTRYARLMANASAIRTDAAANTPLDDPYIYQMRAQFNF